MCTDSGLSAVMSQKGRQDMAGSIEVCVVIGTEEPSEVHRCEEDAQSCGECHPEESANIMVVW